MRDTTIVRRALVAAGAPNHYVWTNKYKNCRTVKTWGGIGGDIHIAALEVAKCIPGATVKAFRSRMLIGCWVDTIIVRVPLTY